MSDSSAHAPNLRPHPLAVELALRLPAGASVLDFACGRGRNAAYLRERGFSVEAVPDGEAAAFQAARRYDGAISTHGLLHGTSRDIRTAVGEIARALEPGAPLHATFASLRDFRFGEGTRLSERTFAPESGEEQGVPHTFFDERGVRELLSESFTIEAMEERGAEHIAGSVHWFVRALRI